MLVDYQYWIAALMMLVPLTNIAVGLMYGAKLGGVLMAVLGGCLGAGISIAMLQARRQFLRP